MNLRWQGLVLQLFQLRGQIELTHCELSFLSFQALMFFLKDINLGLYLLLSLLYFLLFPSGIVLRFNNLEVAEGLLLDLRLLVLEESAHYLSKCDDRCLL